VSNNLKDFPDNNGIFIDANIFLHHAFGTNDVSIEFLKRVENIAVKAFTSVLVLEEVFFKLLLQQASNFIEKITVKKLKSYLQDDVKRSEIFTSLTQYQNFITILKGSGLRIIELRGTDLDIALHLAERWGIVTADAFHLAVMKRRRLTHLASDDTDFERVQEITLWRPKQ
jgi:predicted nucleic acid-binding protein